MQIRNIVQQCRHIFGLLALLLLSIPVVAAPTVSRYFPFVDDPSTHFQQADNYLKPSLFMLNATSAVRRSGQTGGIGELDGQYNLRDVIDSLTTYRTQAGLAAYINPLSDVLWQDKNLTFKVENKVRGTGFGIAYDHKLPWHGLSVGFFAPLLYITTVQRFLVDVNASDDIFKGLSAAEVSQLDDARRQVHKDLGLQKATWNRVGFGDLDFHLGWNKFLDHWKIFRSFNFHARLGAIVPTGTRPELENPTSVPGGSQHWGNYLEGGFEAELKQTLRAGFLASSVWMYNDSRVRRLSVYKEPTAYSPLVAKASVHPGWTMKLSPYFVYENLLQGMHVQVGYSYVRHGNDEMKDLRDDTTVHSYLNQIAATGRTLINVNDNRELKEYLSGWRAHYLSLKLTYDSVAALKNWRLKPTFSAAFDYPMTGRGIAKTTQITLSTGLQF